MGGLKSSGGKVISASLKSPARRITVGNKEWEAVVVAPSAGSAQEVVQLLAVAMYDALQTMPIPRHEKAVYLGENGNEIRAALKYGGHVTFIINAVFLGRP